MVNHLVKKISGIGSSGEIPLNALSVSVPSEEGINHALKGLTDQGATIQSVVPVQRTAIIMACEDHNYKLGENCHLGLFYDIIVHYTLKIKPPT